MKSLYLATALSLAALPVWAQDRAPPTPADVFEQHWGDTVTASRVFDMMTRGLAESGAPLVKAYREQAAALKQAQTELAAAEARLSTAMDWLKQAQQPQEQK